MTKPHRVSRSTSEEWERLRSREFLRSSAWLSGKPPIRLPSIMSTCRTFLAEELANAPEATVVCLRTPVFNTLCHSGGNTDHHADPDITRMFERLEWNTSTQKGPAIGRSFLVIRSLSPYFLQYHGPFALLLRGLAHLSLAFLFRQFASPGRHSIYQLSVS
jgi:hypothetical protein